MSRRPAAEFNPRSPFPLAGRLFAAIFAFGLTGAGPVPEPGRPVRKLYADPGAETAEVRARRRARRASPPAPEPVAEETAKTTAAAIEARKCVRTAAQSRPGKRVAIETQPWAVARARLDGEAPGAGARP